MVPLAIFVIWGLGVVRKESRSSCIGAIERGQQLFAPCDLIGVGGGTAVLAVALAAVVALTPTPAQRVAIAFVGVLVIVLLVVVALDVPSVALPRRLPPVNRTSSWQRDLADSS